MGNGSGGGGRSGGVGVARVGAVRPHGIIAQLSSSATRVLAACCTVLDGDGTICATVAGLAERSGRSRITVRRALDALADAGLVHRSGRTRGRFRYVDAQVLEALQVPTGRRTDHQGWRQLRARCGGFERAYNAARRRAEAAEQALTSRPSAPAVVDAAVVDAFMRSEALHAIECIDGADGCDRCAQLKALLEEGDAAEIADAARDALEEAADVKRIAGRVVEVFTNGVGVVGLAEARSKALAELGRVVR